MNFRELFSKLDELMVPGDDQPMADKMSKDANAPSVQDTAKPDMQKPIPGAQPQLGPKPAMVAPAVPYGQRAPQPQAVPDPKADIAAMSKALQVMAMQNKQAQPNMGMQGIPTSAEKATPVGIQNKQSIGRPGEPLEEAGDWTSTIRNKKDATSRARDLVSGDSPDARRMRAYIAHIEKNPGDIYKVKDPDLQQRIALEINKNPDLKARVVAAKETPAPATPPADGKTTPPADGKTTPPADGKTTPPADGKTTPPADGKTTPPADGKTTPPADGKTTPPAPGKNEKGEPVDTSAKVKPAGDGPTGLALAKLGITRDNRRDQAFVDKTLGAGKFTAGTAASNLALLAAAEEKAKKPADAAPAQAAPAPAPAQAAPAPAQAAPAPAQAAPAPAQTLPLQPGAVDGRIQQAPAVAAPAQSTTRGMGDAEAARERVRQAEADREAVRQADIIAKYGSLDPTKVQVRTGNVNKPWYELKTGDIDYDKDGRKIVYTKDPTGGPGNWSAGSWKDHTANPFSKETPGVFFGPKYDSEEGKKFVDAYRNRTINPDEYELLKKHWEKNTSPAAAPAAAPTTRSVALGRAAPNPDGSPQTINVSNKDGVQTSAKEGPSVRPEVADALGANRNGGAQESGYQPMKTINGVRTFDPLNIGRADPKENVELHEMANQLNLLAEELTEWSMSDRIHKDVPYSYSDAATDAGIAGLGALATYATGGLAAPLVGAATAARGGRLANMVYKGVQGAKNIGQGVKAVATNPEARALANQNANVGKMTKGAATAVAGDAALQVGGDKAADKLTQVANNIRADIPANEDATSELDRIKQLSRR
jgi:hypothetical protein